MNKLKILLGSILVLSTFVVSAFAFTFPTTDFPSPICIAKLTFSTPSTVGIPVMFDASSSTCMFASITKYTFYFGDGKTVESTTPRVFHAYSSPGTYRVSVVVSTLTTKASTSVSIDVDGPQIPVPSVPVCGNRIIEAGEECDDGNRISGDGCSAACTIEAPEPVIPDVPVIGTGCPNVYFASSTPVGTAPLEMRFMGKAEAFLLFSKYWNYTIYYDYGGDMSLKKTGMLGPDIRTLGSYAYGSGNYKAKLFVNCLVGQTSKEISVRVLPAIEYNPVIGWFRSEPSSGYAPLTAKFKSSAVTLSPLPNNLLTYTLFFDIDDRSKNTTGAIDSTDKVLGEFTYLSGGTFGKTYTAEIVVTDSLGKSSSKRTSTSVAPAWTDPDNSGNNYPQIAFTYEPIEAYINQEIKFTDTSTDTDGHLIFWSWTFGDGAKSELQNPTHVYGAEGSYTVTLKAYDDDGYSNLTRKTIQVRDGAYVPVCGDGLFDTQTEECDDGNTVDGDGCSATCLIETLCGNGVIDVGEECDDGNTNDNDGCSSACFLETHWCGDGAVDAGEECDDGNDVNNDGCNNVCTLPVCGNAIVDLDEQCDDGNTVDGDGCSAVCVTEAVPEPPVVYAGGGGGGGGMYLGPPTPAPLRTEWTSVLGFHPSYALSGARDYNFDESTNVTTLSLKVKNLAKTNRTLVIKDIIPKTIANTMQDVQVIPVPMNIYNIDPEIGWNVTLAPDATFEARYILDKYVSFADFDAMELPVITEITETEEIPVSPTEKVTIAGIGITGLFVSTVSNPVFGLIVLLVLVAAFFAFTETGRNSWKEINTRTDRFLSSIVSELEDEKKEKTSEKTKRLKKLMKAKPKRAKKRR